MIINAGLMALAPLRELKMDEWDAMIDINVKGVLYGIAAALPAFQKQESGHFINIALVARLKVFGNAAVYSATKFAVRTISEGLRAEVGGKIRSTVISPGAVASELKHGSSHAESASAVLDFYEIAIPADAVARDCLRHRPAGRRRHQRNRAAPDRSGILSRAGLPSTASAPSGGTART